MVYALRGVFSEREPSTLIAKFLFLLVALLSLLNSVAVTEWWQSLLSLVLVLLCGILIDNGYEDIKFTVMESIGMEVTNPSESRTSEEVQDLLSDSDASDLAEVDVNEAEGTYQVQFDRE